MDKEYCELVVSHIDIEKVKNKSVVSFDYFCDNEIEYWKNLISYSEACFISSFRGLENSLEETRKFKENYKGDKSDRTYSDWLKIYWSSN